MIRKLFSSQLRINMASGVVTTIINSIAVVIAYPIYLHFLGYEKYGVWLILTTVLTFVRLGNFGVSKAVTKLVAEEYSRNNIEEIQRYIITAMALLCLSGIVALIGILLFKTQLIALFRLSGENARIVSWLLPYIGLLGIYAFIVDVLNATVSGLGRMDLANYIQAIGPFAAVPVASILLYNGRGIESLFIASTLSYIFIQVTSLICIRRIANIRLLQIANLDFQQGKRILCFGGPVFVGQLINMLVSPFNKLILSRYVGVSAIPIYEIAYNGSMHIRALFEIGLRALMPEVSRISGDMTKYAKYRMSQIYHHAMELVLFGGIPIYGGVIVLLTPLLKLWLGHKFVVELPFVFRIMLISTFLNLISVPAYYILIGLGVVRHTLIAHIIFFCISVLIVLTNVFIWHTVSINTISWTILTATGNASLYLIYKNRCILK